jgi:bifunctional UDP-N-acetylglucosamine pyrophosphorylase/glucosamine-1-phosphate N-acetyltransferase
MSFPVDVVVMAAGKGTRMKSLRPKVLHRLGGRALAQHVIDCAARLSARSVVVITGHGAEQVEAGLTTPVAVGDHTAPRLRFVRQEPQLGTGHAVQQAVPVLADDGVVLILNGDVPLIGQATLETLLQACDGQHLALLSVDTGGDATGYGRIVRSLDADRSVHAIVEHKDANEAQRRITEWYSGVMAAPASLLKPLLKGLTNDNSQREYYLTDVVKHAVAQGLVVRAVTTHDAVEVAGVNSPVQLAELERAHHAPASPAPLMEQGVRWRTRRGSTCAANCSAARTWRSTSTACLKAA